MLCVGLGRHLGDLHEPLERVVVEVLGRVAHAIDLLEAGLPLAATLLGVLAEGIYVASQEGVLALLLTLLLDVNLVHLMLLLVVDVLFLNDLLAILFVLLHLLLHLLLLLE